MYSSEAFGRGVSSKAFSRILTVSILIIILLALFNFSTISFLTTGDSGAANQDSLWSPFTISESMPRRSTKAIIATVLRKNEEAADWIVDMLPDWEPHIFMADGTIDDAQALSEQHAKKTPLAFNRGREASSYLSYIITHYYNLPDYLVFLHGERYQTHNDDPMYDTYPLIKNLELDYVDLEGYVNLRCNWKHCPEPYIVPKPGHQDSVWEAHGDYAEAWQFIFPNVTLPAKVAAPCCAQFAVNRQTIHRWPVAKYEQIREWMWERGEGIPSMKSGIVLEYMWHIMFGKPAYWCPPVRDCYCGTWGMCDLDCDEEKGWCKGRIWTPDPPGRLPMNWPEEGQDGKEWPVRGWEKDPNLGKEH